MSKLSISLRSDKIINPRSFLLLILLILLALIPLTPASHSNSKLTAKGQPSQQSQAPEDFTIIALPDTQFYSESYPNVFDSQTQWIASNVEAINIKFVSHEGDIVNQNTISQWNNANHSMSILDGVVPYGVLPATHDGNPSNLANYNTYFPKSRFEDESWYGGGYQDTNVNSYQLFTGGYDNYLIFHFQQSPSDSVLAWANTILANYPDRRVIVTTHDYLDVTGIRRPEGDHIWNSFVAPHSDQIFLVLCGHMHAENRRSDIVNGHTVYQLLADYQEGYPNGGNGWLRILEFQPAEDKIQVRTYSPYINQNQMDEDSQFTLDYDMTSDPPFAINLESPEDEASTMDNMPDFSFTATHTSQTTFTATLWLENATHIIACATKNDVANATLTTLTPSTPIPNDDWSWWIDCTDGPTSATSEIRTIEINTFRGDKTFTSTLDGTTRTYWLDLPDNFDSSVPTALVIFLHGYEGSRLSYPQKYSSLKQTFQSNTWIVASVDCRTTGGYQNWYTEPSRQDITDVITIIKSDYNIDNNHVHVMGNSMGGGGALKYAMFNNQVIASLVDIHGVTDFTQFYYESPTYRASLREAYGGNPSQVPDVYANESPLGNENLLRYTPVMILHGDADPTVSVSHSRNLNQNLNALGYTVNYIEVPGAVHDANSLIIGRELEILNWFKDHPLIPSYNMHLNAGWNMVSFPIIPDDASFASIFNGLTYYQVVTWTGTSYTSSTTAEAGRGYWVLTLSTTDVTTRGASVESYEVDLPAGWSMIGGIYDAAVKAGDVFPSYYQLVTWSGTGYVTASTVEPGKGYWALVLESTHTTVAPNVKNVLLSPLFLSESDARWMDIADQTYSSSYRESYDYSQSTISLEYSTIGEKLTGKLVAQNLKPNFAYQLKLVGTPGFEDNERVGKAGRWWEQEWTGTAWTGGSNLNNKGTGYSPNPNDITYLERRDVPDVTSPTGYHYRYTGYLVFAYFITDNNGAATIYFETGNSYHVLWKTDQQTPTADDGPVKTSTFNPDGTEPAYNVNYPIQTISLFGEWERLPPDSINLANGNYECQIILTEESFHGTAPLEGNWAAAMVADISFTIVA